MKASVGLSRWSLLSSFRLHPSYFFSWRRSQVVRQRSAKPLFIGSIPIAASNKINSAKDAGMTGNYSLEVPLNELGRTVNGLT